MVFKELIFNSLYVGGGCGGLERTDLYQFLLWVGVVVLKELILTVSALGGCGGPKRIDFYQFICWVGAVVLKELIFFSFYIGRMWCCSKN